MPYPQVFIYFCWCFVLGILICTWLAAPLAGLVFLTAGILLVIVFYKRQPKIVVLGMLIIGLGLGLWRGQIVKSDFSEDYGQVVELAGLIVQEPAKTGENIKYVIRPIENARVSNLILLSAAYYPGLEPIAYGDLVQVKGKLVEPKVFVDFNYKEYLARQGIGALIYEPEIELAQTDAYCQFESKAACLFYKVKTNVFWLKSKLAVSLDRVFLPPHNALLKAILLGDKSGLEAKLNEDLSRAGVRHIIAISGMHMAIIAQIIMYLGLAAGLWRRQVFWLVVIIMFLYVLMIGAPASAVRGALMAGVLVLAQVSGRLSQAGRALFIVGAVMVSASPNLLAFDVGFQLSFAAVLGLIYGKPLLDKLFAKAPNFGYAKDLLLMSVAAQLTTLPILLWNFGQVSVVAPVSNVLIVPWLPVIMIYGLAMAVLGAVFVPLALFLSLPLQMVLICILKVVELVIRLPFSAVTIKAVPWLFVLAYYLVLLLIGKKFSQKQRLV